VVAVAGGGGVLVGGGPSGVGVAVGLGCVGCSVDAGCCVGGGAGVSVTMTAEGDAEGESEGEGEGEGDGVTVFVADALGCGVEVAPTLWADPLALVEAGVCIKVANSVGTGTVGAGLATDGGLPNNTSVA
jgi:hypothetical protein